MSLISKLDLYRRISVDEIKRSSMLGLTLSFVFLVVLVYFTVYEAKRFMTPAFKHSSVLEQDKEDNQIKVYLELEFPHCPCALLSVDYQDRLGNHKLDISSDIIKSSMDSKGKIIEVKGNPFDKEFVRSVAEKRFGCHLSGFVRVSKVPGEIHISHHAFRGPLKTLLDEYPEYEDFLDLSHHVSNIYFGKNKVSNNILNHFGVNEYANFFPMLPIFPEASPLDSYSYYFKLVPIIFRDQYFSPSTVYQYSVNGTTHKPKTNENMPKYTYHRETQVSDMTSVTFNFDFSPISLKIEPEYYSLRSFLTDFCAVVGGFYFILRFVVRFLAK